MFGTILSLHNDLIDELDQISSVTQLENGDLMVDQATELFPMSLLRAQSSDWIVPHQLIGRVTEYLLLTYPQDYPTELMVELKMELLLQRFGKIYDPDQMKIRINMAEFDELKLDLEMVQLLDVIPPSSYQIEHTNVIVIKFNDLSQLYHILWNRHMKLNLSSL